ncbi:hypothetical protein HDU87_000584 [Geranomyces variabilis]|uniref:Smr domain-containing protein n=1 Tax=Geranomyces variabilis TaxID=109894 RepID=A0AAD5XIM1_9FUNG|nr:hypothetical protein HDU87_000584 [Geranomyces variabilis]
MNDPPRLHTELFSFEEISKETFKLISPSELPAPAVYPFPMLAMQLQKTVGARHAMETIPDKGPGITAKGMAQTLRMCVPRESLQEIQKGVTASCADHRVHYQLLLADCYMFGLKGAKRDSERASQLWYEAAYGGLPEACIAVAQICYYKLVGLERDVPVPVIPRTSPNYVVLEQMWFWLDAALERDWICPFVLHLAQQAKRNGSWKLSARAKKVLRDRDVVVKREVAEMEAQHSVRCARPDCIIRVTSSSQLKACGRCHGVSYCSASCQHVDWRERHKAVCVPSDGPAPATASGKTESGKGQSVNLSLGGISITSTTLDADYLTTIGNVFGMERFKLMCSVRGQSDLPPLEYRELMRQARDLMEQREYAAAKRCLTRAADEVWMRHPVFGKEADDRRDMLRILRLGVKCSLALSEKHMSETDVDSALEDLELLLTTGIFPLEELEPDVLEDLRRMGKQAKLQKARLSHSLPMQTPQSRTRRNKNGKKKKQAIKKDELDVIVVSTEQLLTLDVATNACSSDDGCTICLTGWTDFTTFTLAVVPPCQHATCAPCLSRFQKACKKSFESATSAERVKVVFACVLCRSAFPETLTTTAAQVSIQRSLVPAFQDLPQHLGVADPEDRRRLLTSLLTAHDFDLAQVTDILFRMVGVVTTTAVQDLTHDDKQRIYDAAREPVRKLAEEHRLLRAKLGASYESNQPEWRATLARAREVAEALGKARENAAADIYERVNAAGKMGHAALNGRAPVHVDLHGLHEDEARRNLIEFVFPTLPVLKTVNVITGKGAHSKDGEGVLRDLVKTLAVAKGFRVEKTKNAGVLALRA